MISPSQPVGDIAANVPGAARVLESHRIDYCCGGRRTLGEACARASVPIDLVLGEIQALAPSEPRVWPSLTALIAHIIDVHHAYARAAIQRIDPLATTVARVHGDRHPELFRVRELFDLLRAELEPHMRSEEGMLFPAVLQLSSPTCLPQRREALRLSVVVMQHDHDAVGRVLREMREVTTHFAAPADACDSYRALYAELEAFEHDLHEHIHLENNVLLPRAIAGETGPASSRRR